MTEERIESKDSAKTEFLLVEGTQKSASSELITSQQKESPMYVPSKCQITIHVGFEKTNKLSIQRSNNADLEMALVEFFHCKNTPDRIVDLMNDRYC